MAYRDRNMQKEHQKITNCSLRLHVQLVGLNNYTVNQLHKILNTLNLHLRVLWGSQSKQRLFPCT